LFGECVCVHCFDCSLVTTFTNETQVSSPVICAMWLRNSLSLWYYCRKFKSRIHSLRSVCAREHFRNLSCVNLW
jgi:hypothetical protein